MNELKFGNFTRESLIAYAFQEELITANELREIMGFGPTENGHLKKTKFLAQRTKQTAGHHN